MAKYTIELRDIVNSGVNIFPFNYDFYDRNKQPEFEQKFIKHFYFREIGCDTIDRFLFYLEEKFGTVFPYYNELFKTAQVEYSILDNYNIKETTTLKRDNLSRSNGVSSSVGSVHDKQTAEGTESRTTDGQMDDGTDSESTQTTSETTKTVKDGTTDTTRSGTASSEHSETVDETLTKEGSSETTEDKTALKKFLDTPQGKVDLIDNKYLTNLTNESVTGSGTSETSETNTDKKTTAGSESSESSETENSESSETVDGTGNKTITETASSGHYGLTKETVDGKTGSTYEGEQRTSADINLRNENMGSVSETVEHTRKGNIGVDTDADMIQKHIKLQQTLRKIELQFFAECEDLFMLVY